MLPVPTANLKSGYLAPNLLNGTKVTWRWPFPWLAMYMTEGTRAIWPSLAATSNLRTRMLKCFSSTTSTTSWLGMEIPSLILKDSWHIMRKPIGMPWVLSTDLEILKFPAKGARIPLTSIGHVFGETHQTYITTYTKHDLRDQHKRPCLQYHDASSMLAAETRCLAIKAWWLLSNCTSEEGLKHLLRSLASWHFHFWQWGGFIELMRFDC